MKRVLAFFGGVFLWGLCLAVSAPSAHADLIAYSFTNTVGNFALANGRGNVTLGFAFTANADILVTQLGVFDSNQNGLSDSHDVGLWTDTGTLLVSVTVPSGTGATLDGAFRYASVAHTSLAAGHSYVIGVSYPSGADTLVMPASGFSTDPSITYAGNRFGGASALTFPGSSGGAAFDPGNFGPNFKFTPVPEPSALSMLLISGVMAGLLRQRGHLLSRG